MDLEFATADDAMFVLVHGPDVIRAPAGAADGDAHTGYHSSGVVNPELSATLRRCKERGLPMVCCNPDIKVVNPDSSISCVTRQLARDAQCHALGRVRGWLRVLRAKRVRCVVRAWCMSRAGSVLRQRTPTNAASLRAFSSNTQGSC